jgi:hypothetical protein
MKNNEEKIIILLKQIEEITAEIRILMKVRIFCCIIFCFKYFFL